MKANASYNTKQLRKLNEEVSTLRSQVQELQQDHTTLQVQQHILARLVSWAHGLLLTQSINLQLAYHISAVQPPSILVLILSLTPSLCSHTLQQRV
jgi:TolA-binding protein